MEDICTEFFTHGFCTKTEVCSLAHDINDLDQYTWIIIPQDTLLQITDYLSPTYLMSLKYVSCCVEESIVVLLRFHSVKEAVEFKIAYWSYFNPLLLAEFINKTRIEQGSLAQVQLEDTSTEPTLETSNNLTENKSMDTNIPETKQNIQVTNYSRNENVIHNPNEGTDTTKPIQKNNYIQPYERYSQPVYQPQPYVQSYHSNNPSNRLFMNSKGDDEQWSRRVIAFLTSSESSKLRYKAGWAALREIWGMDPNTLDQDVLKYLNTKPQADQEQILLSFAAIGLTNIKNHSAYLNCLIREHETVKQVCIYFLAGMCTQPQCRYVHPSGTLGWSKLEARWGITFRDLDYAVLNYLCKKTDEQQEYILMSLADMNLKQVKNLSAYLSRMIQMCDPDVKRRPPRFRGFI